MTDPSRELKKKCSFMTQYEKSVSNFQPCPSIVKNETLETEIARSYQIELFQKAKSGNIIAVLDTGTGKVVYHLKTDIDCIVDFETYSIIKSRGIGCN
jgi:hypothetical protein